MADPARKRSQDRSLKIFISAGEVSGDLLGGRILAALKRHGGADLDIQGVGGPSMEEQGLKSLFPMSDLAVMGLVEILPHIRHLKRRIRETSAAAQAFNPDVMITIDAPGFNKRVVRLCRNVNFPIVHYVAPTVWAWRPKRVFAFRDLFDTLLCLLPFEPPYFTKVGLDARFVGHSILECGADVGSGTVFREKNNIPASCEVLCVLPGSRRGEVSQLLGIFGETARLLQKQCPNLHVVMPTVPHLEEFVRHAIRDWSIPVTLSIGPDQKYDAMAASNIALAASGTVALELAMARVPTVVAYRVNTITHYLLRRMIKVRFAHLLNIIADREIVPEAIQDDCTPENLTNHLVGLLSEKGEVQVSDLEPYLRQLSPPDGVLPSDAAALAVLDVLQKKTRST